MTIVYWNNDDIKNKKNAHAFKTKISRNDKLLLFPCSTLRAACVIDNLAINVILYVTFGNRDCKYNLKISIVIYCNIDIQYGQPSPYCVRKTFERVIFTSYIETLCLKASSFTKIIKPGNTINLEFCIVLSNVTFCKLHQKKCSKKLKKWMLLSLSNNHPL